MAFVAADRIPPLRKGWTRARPHPPGHGAERPPADCIHPTTCAAFCTSISWRLPSRPRASPALGPSKTCHKEWCIVARRAAMKLVLLAEADDECGPGARAGVDSSRAQFQVIRRLAPPKKGLVVGTSNRNQIDAMVMDHYAAPFPEEHGCPWTFAPLLPDRGSRVTLSGFANEDPGCWAPAWTELSPSFQKPFLHQRSGGGRPFGPDPGAGRGLTRRS